MSEFHWVMASSALYREPDGRGGLFDVLVSNSNAGWKWSAIRSGVSLEFYEMPEGCGHGFPDPISARTAAEYWLTVTREQNALRAALESEVES